MYKSTIYVLLLISFTYLIACDADNNYQTSNEESIEMTDPNESLPKNSTVILAVGEWEPYISEELPDYGFTAEIVKESFLNVGISVEFEFYPWSRSYSLCKEGKVLGTFPWEDSEERKNDFFLTDHFWSNEEKLLYLDSNKIIPNNYNSVEDIEHLKIGGVRFYTYLDKFEEMGLEVDIRDNEVDCINSVITGRNDICPVNQIAAIEIIKDNFPDQIDNLKYLDNPFNTNNGGMLISKNYENSEYYLNKFNEGLQELKTSGAYNDILIKHNLEVLLLD